MKVLITGVSGFIAPHVVEASLKEGFDVVGVDKQDCSIKDPKFTFLKKDVRDLSPYDMKGVDYVFHLAFVTNIPYSVEHPLETTNENIGMTIHLLQLSAEAKVKRFVFPSTASQYGNNPVPWTEDMLSDPIEPYSWQKLSCEFALKMWSERYGLPTVIFRLLQVFGENQREDTALAAFFRARKEGKPITLTKTTAQSTFKSAQRDFIYVKDIATAFVKAAESNKVGKGEIINIGSGLVNTIEEVADAIGGEVIFIPQRHYEVERHEVDVSKAKKLINFKAKTNVLPWIKEQVKNI